MPENEKAEWENSPLNLLKLHVSKVTASVPQNPDHIVSKTRNITDIPNDWTKMDKNDIKKNWGAILGNAVGRKN